MTSRIITDSAYDDLQLQVKRLVGRINDLANRKKIIVPIWDADTIPTTFPDGVTGEFVYGADGVLYIWADGLSEWVAITTGGGGPVDIDAIDVDFDPTGLSTITATDVQNALEQVDAELDVLIAAIAAISPLQIITAITTPATLSVFNGTVRAYAIHGGTISGVHISVGTQPTGASVNVRLNKNGSSIGTGTIAVSTNTSTITPSPTTFSSGDYFTVDITQIGSTIPGTDLVVEIYGTY